MEGNGGIGARWFQEQLRRNLYSYLDDLENEDGDDGEVFKEIPFKGISVPAGQPRSSIRDPINISKSVDPSAGPTIESGPVVLHCGGANSPLMKYTGVYAPFFRDDILRYGYKRDPDRTKAFLKEMGDNVRKLANRGHCFQLCHDNKVHQLMGYINKREEHHWYLFCEDGEQFIELRTPRVRDVKFWCDPDQFQYSDEVFSQWFPLGKKAYGEALAITPLETAKRALTADQRVPRKKVPLKYQKATDYAAWDRNFVLHVDPRTCQLPHDWVDSTMGVYKPVQGKVESGYPVWKRESNLTKELVDAMSKPVKKYLESQGIRLAHSDNKEQFLYVDKNFSDFGQCALLSAASLNEINSKRRQQKQPIFIGNLIPEHIDSLLSDPTSLFAAPDKAFATWSAFYLCDWVKLHVAFTPEEYFREAISLAALEVGDAPEQPSNSKKKKRKKKKAAGKKREKKTVAETQEGKVDGPVTPHDANAAGGSTTNIDSPGEAAADEAQRRLMMAWDVLRHFATLLGMDASSIPCTTKQADSVQDSIGFQQWEMEKILHFLFDDSEASGTAWTSVSDSISSPILEAALLSTECSKWIRDDASRLVILFSEKVRQEDLTILLNAGNVSVTAKALSVLFCSLPKDTGCQFNNKIASVICSKCIICMECNDDFKLVKNAAFSRVGKAGKKAIIDALKQASSNMKKSKKNRSKSNGSKAKETDMSAIKKQEENMNAHEEGVEVEADSARPGDGETNLAQSKQLDFKEVAASIQGALKFYFDQLDKLVTKASIKDNGEEGKSTKSSSNEEREKVIDGDSIKKPNRFLTPDQVVSALSKCESDDALEEVETGIDLFQWDSMSEWSIDITENAHKWFNRHKTRDREMCERVILRLILLSTGRWPYVLCKPLKSKSKKIRLYETKINKASRIIWEVAIAFSPRRSSLDQNYCEQVIRVWDIVLDHDNLSRAISQTVQRIEKSHIRGEACALYAEIDKANGKSSNDGTKDVTIPRVFPMSQEVMCVGSTREQTPKGRSRHFHPASDDDRQFTLLKFYELNSGAIKILLDGNDDNTDLPFTPGPKEHEIIHFSSDPQRSILLMGRSGTGKTTCLVFRMWAQYAQYMDGHQGSQPRQLFLTKNDVLCREVERSFDNMGLAWRKRIGTNVGKQTEEKKQAQANERSNLTKFLTSSELLDALEVHLPGERFFTPQELDQRVDSRKQKDTVTKGVEDLLSGEVGKKKEVLTCRSEMTFTTFRKLWRKIRSGSGSQMDSVLVWKEIKSFIKGSVAALQLNHKERTITKNRFLSLNEYLELPRKQSRMDETQRREVYGLFLAYEKLKKEGYYYDECDLVYNIAGRISLADSTYLEQMATENSSLLLIDALFVDEVQDFTQAELYILAKLCRDPNNLFLAGDTAQSIAVGVDFRFTDVRQIFYNHFGGIEPKLLQLSHNYRSHAGVLRLAACVVELLYHFFSNSLDKLPPDLGLFDGPKPVIMEVSSPTDLVLMLEGAKRETSRIEFGAHQVVLVSSEEAKKNLPDEFSIDRDWVMTVQQSKGLEFDDVLLYNFFTDSKAKDMWRVVSNYSEEDIAAYYADATVAASGVQKYDWQSPMLTETRHLDFSVDQHKILETELKMLYTAITRARVNVFIAETNIEQSRPMFNYFRKRCVVDIVNKETSEGLSGVRVFGVNDNNIEDWRKRGEYYLKNAEGDRAGGCLRLAAKCFDRAQDEERKRIALAFLAFTEVEEDSNAKKGKHAMERKEKLYNITVQLLEAQDIGFLNKAALCLLRTGAHDEDAARMFELYARLRYTSRICDEKGHASLPLAPSLHERKYFSYAGKLFARCSQYNENTRLALASFRNFLCSNDYEDANLLLSSGMLPLRDGQTFLQLHVMCVPKEDKKEDPIASFQDSFASSDKCASLRSSIKRVASIGCRNLYKKDVAGFFAALQLIPNRNDRIKLLSSIDENDSGLALSNKPWASHHLFREEGSEKVAVDLVNMLVRELDSEKRYNEAAETLENRGFLLEAAERYDRLSREYNSRSLASKAAELRVRWVELMILANKRSDDREVLLSRVSLDGIGKNDIPADVRYAALLARAELEGRASVLLEVVMECKASVMWRNRSLKMIFKSKYRDKLLDSLPGRNTSDRLGIILTIAEEMKHLAVALRRKSNMRSQEESLKINHAEGYFDLSQHRLDRTRLETNPVVNLRLREVLDSEQCTLHALSAANSLNTNGTQVVDRDKMHFKMSQYVYKEVASLLMALEDLTRAQEKSGRQCTGRSVPTTQLQEYVDCLQVHTSCIKLLSSLHHGTSTSKEPWVSVRKKINEGRQYSPKCLMDVLLSETQLFFTTQSKNFDTDTTNLIILKPEATNSLMRFVSESFRKLPMQSKKQDIKHAIIYWRLLRFCSLDESYASNELRKEILRMERHRQTGNESRKKQGLHFINMRKKEVYPRLWLWAVESAPDNIMNSISVVERMIQTSNRGGLTPITKIDQVSLLEVNSVAIFGAISLRYSEVGSPQMLILKHFYLRRLLDGDSGCLQGFGVPLKKSLLAYCHKQFDVVFEKCVLHLENTVGIILNNGLLSAPGGRGGEGETLDVHRFESALHLSIFICCNAIVFSSSGKDMDTIEFKRDLSSLPSLPLQGNVRKLVVELRKMFTQENWPSHMDIFLAGRPRTFLDLAKISDSLLRLRASKRDSHILCKLQQTSEDGVNFLCSEKLDKVSEILSMVPFDDCGMFENWDARNVSFLKEVGRFDPNCDDCEHGRKSEELNASRVIFQFVDSKIHAQRNAEVDEAIAYFQHWKTVMRAFIEKVKIVAREKSPSSQEGIEPALEEDEEAIVCAFEKIVNPFQDSQLFHAEKQNAFSEFNNAITDAIECTYCSLPFDPKVQAERFLKWDMEGRRMHYREFVRNFNRDRFGNEERTSGDLVYHLHLSMHHDNVLKYNQNLEYFATAMARMKIGLRLLDQIISMCDQEGQREDAFSSWYLHTAEEGRELSNRIGKALSDVGNAGIIWSRQPSHQYLWEVLPGTYCLPGEAESFFMKKKDEEVQIKERMSIEKNSQGNSESDRVEASILNPDAASFIPQFLS